MELDIRVGTKSLAIPIENPFRLDMDSIMKQIEQFAASNDAPLNSLDIRGLLPRMVKGIAGCEAGCPSDAHRVVSQGHQNFKIEYIEGGILSATARIEPGKNLAIKLFPDF